MNVLYQINEAKANCLESGRKPICLLINPSTLRQLKKELRINQNLKNIIGLDINVKPQITDFFLVDDRSWVDQKW